MIGKSVSSYLDQMIEQAASDLYLTVDAPPTLRIRDHLQPLPGPALLAKDIDTIVEEILLPQQLADFKTNREMNIALDNGRRDRFRVNIMRQRQQTALVIRRITNKIPSLDELGLPSIVKDLTLEKRGLVFICGVTASGKSTTLAAMVDLRNTTLDGHIITLEDPIEFYHEHKKGIVSQREIGIDTASYHIAMNNALRQKPDVIMVGEVRDAGVMELTIAAAESGHLCYATLHTKNAAQAVDRIVNLFREERRQQIRMAMVMNLRAIVVQRLVQNTHGGLTLVAEVLLNESLVKDLILNSETHKIHEVMAANNTIGMITFDQALFKHYVNGEISAETAIFEADVPSDMKIKIQQHDLKVDGKNPHVDTLTLSL